LETRFKVGDHVAWNSEAGRVSGTIVKVHLSNVNHKGYVHHASAHDPQYEIKSDKTDRGVETPAWVKSQMVHSFFTIGHSTRTIPEFMDLLRAVEISLVVDVRTVPRSRTNPQYNADNLPRALAQFNISYRHIAALGGLRRRTKHAT
jgi:hypothetical protein